MKRIWFAMLVLAVLVSSGCTNSKTSEERHSETTARLILQPLPATLPVHAAVEQGIFARNGLDVEVTEGTDAVTAFASLTSGQTDLAMSTVTTVLVGTEKGFDVEIVSSLHLQSAEKPGFFWITKDPSIASLADLKGKTIGVPALTGVVADSLVYLLQRNGVSKDDVNLAIVPFAAMSDQLEAGRLDAAVAGSPFSNAMKARGFTLHDDVGVTAVTDASDGATKKAIGALFAATREYADANPETIEAFRKSLQEAIDFLQSNPDVAREYIQSWLKMPPEVAKTVPLPDWQVDITVQDLQPYVVMGEAIGTIKSEPDLNSLLWQGQ